MRALVYRDRALTFEQDYPFPVTPEGEALIRVSQVGICNTDIEITRGYMDFAGVPGHEFVGVVEEVAHSKGASTPLSLVGKRVVGEINAACRKSTCWSCQRGMHTHCPERTTLGIVKRDGAFAEYLTLPVENLHVVPNEVSDDEAVFVEPLAANFEILEQVHLKPTDRVIVLGDGKMGQLAARVLVLSRLRGDNRWQTSRKAPAGRAPWNRCQPGGGCGRCHPARAQTRGPGGRMHRLRAGIRTGAAPCETARHGDFKKHRGGEKQPAPGSNCH